jgi:hypothetical protein
MKFLRDSLVVLLAVAMVVAFTSPPASASTEMIPGSRLIFPYVDIVSGRNTFLLITNSSINISAPVHLTFYGQSCQRSDQEVFLTPRDIAAVDVQVALGSVGALPQSPQPTGAKFTAADGIGWVDVDIRDTTNSSTSPSVEFNGIMGTAILIDVQKDFAFAYPAAASQGSAAGGFATTTAVIGTLGTQTIPSAVIVNRGAGDLATLWTGTYETYNSRIYIPAYFGEDACTAASPALTAFIALAGPADAYRKEAPGSELGLGTVLVDVTGNVFDGVENKSSVAAKGHLMNQRLCTAFPTSKPRPFLNPPAGYASVDQTLGATNSVGWLQLDNINLTPTAAASGPAPNPAFTNGNGFNTAARFRGMVGILFEIQASDAVPIPPGSFSTVKTGDAIRNWNNPTHSSSASANSTNDWNCFPGNATGVADVLVGPVNACTTGNNFVQSDWITRHTQAD